MCVTLCLFSALRCRVDALQISIIIIIIVSVDVKHHVYFTTERPSSAFGRKPQSRKLDTFRQSRLALRLQAGPAVDKSTVLIRTPKRRS